MSCASAKRQRLLAKARTRNGASAPAVRRALATRALHINDPSSPFDLLRKKHNTKTNKQGSVAGYYNVGRNLKFTMSPNSNGDVVVALVGPVTPPAGGTERDVNCRMHFNVRERGEELCAQEIVRAIVAARARAGARPTCVCL